MKRNLILLLTLLSSGLIAQVPQLKINSGHSDEISSVCYSPDDKYIVSGSNDRTIKLWDVATGKELKTFIVGKEVLSVAVYPDGKYILSAGYSGVNIWEVQSGKAINIYPSFSHFANISGDGKYIIYNIPDIDNTIVLYDIRTGSKIKSFEGHQDYVMTAKFSPDGNYIVSGSSDKTIKLWDVESGLEIRTFTGHNDYVNSVNFSADGKLIVSGGGVEDKIIKVWDVSTGKEIMSLIGNTNSVNSVFFSQDGSYITSGSFDGIKFWNCSTGKEIKTYSKDDVSWVRSIAYSHNGKYLVSANTNKTLSIWDVKADSLIASLPGEKMEMDQAFFMPNGKFVINTSSDSYIKHWELDKNGGIRNLLENTDFETEISYFGVMGFTRDFENAICNSIDGSIILINLQTKAKIKTFNDGLGNFAVFSPDGNYMASASMDNTFKIWEVATCQELKTFKGHSVGLNSLNFSPDGKYIVSGSGDFTIKVWNVSNDKETMTLTGHKNSVQSVCFSPDGKYIVSGSCDGNIKVWNALTGKELMNITGKKRSMVSSVKFSLDGRFLLSSHFHEEFAVKLWDFSTGQIIKIFEGHTGDVKSANFSPNEKCIVSASADGSIKIWDIESGKCLITRFDVPNSDDWVTVTPDGRFDGTEAGMKLLYYVKDLEVIPLESFYEKFFTPGLVAQVMNSRGEASNNQLTITSDLKLPPTVKIVSPMVNDKFKTDEVEVVIEATDQGGGVDEIRLYQNGKLVSEEQRGMKLIPKAGETLTKKYRIILLSGKNELKATAFNTDRTEAIPSAINIELRKSIANADLYLVSIGINKYKNQKYNLNYSISDAEGFTEAIATKSMGIFKNIKALILKDEQCTKADILSNFDSLSNVVKPEDVFIFYYAGHGVMSEGSEDAPSEFYFISYDVTQLYGNDEQLKLKGISVNELRRALVNIKAQKLLIVIDACQSGGATEMLAMRGAAEEKALMQLARSTGIAVLSSTGTEQFATEVKQLGHGVYTYSIIEGLNGKADGGEMDGKITIKELAAFLEDRVPELTEKYRGSAQYPNASMRGMDFPIVIWK